MIALAACPADVNLGQLSLTDSDGSSSDATDSADVPTTGEPTAPEDQPVLEWTLSPIKQFRFSWAPVVAGHYQLMESPDVAEPYVQVGEDIAGDAAEVAITVPLYARLNARYVLRACNGMACSESEPVAISGSLAEAVGYIKASNTGVDDSFGSRVAISGDGGTLAVSAPLEGSGAAGVDGDQTDNSAVGAGAVYLFTRVDDAWAQEAYLKAANPDPGDQFGFKLALSGDGATLAVAALYEDSLAAGIDGDPGNAGVDVGAVYVFARTGGAWSQQAYVKASNSGSEDRFGYSVALSSDGDTLAVGALLEEDSPTGGAAYVFTRTGVLWSEEAYLKASNASAYSFFGGDVALDDSGDTLAVGASVESLTGAVYMFARVDGVWSEQAYLRAAIPIELETFGHAVGLSGDGNTLGVGAIGATFVPVGYPFVLGSVYVFRREGSAWAQEAIVKTGSLGDDFGTEVRFCTDGTIMAVGSVYEDSYSIGLNGDQDDDFAPQAGAAYVFRREGDAWWQQAYVKAPNTEGSDYFGSSVALSDDGSILAVGAAKEAGGSSGIGGDQADNAAPGAGAVYLY
ncbi:hypothetical protein [Nannocystis sp.]|uniref:hypothetical protein n=1 Tax=Nannocystis sp. TaxID=1962667 RepID=UPI0025D59052|nr:hypothetical protein [Nannocystis sp.]MBK7827369.1 integrin [Nannocystis sp.]